MIYVIGTGKCRGGQFTVKIGTSRDPEARLRTLQTSSPVRYQLLAVGPGGPQLEATLHRRFICWRRRGEWFSMPPAEFDRLCSYVIGEAPMPEGMKAAHDRRSEYRAAKVYAERWNGTRPWDRPKASPVKTRSRYVARSGVGALGDPLWTFTCPDCHTTIERTSEKAALKQGGQHREIHVRRGTVSIRDRAAQLGHLSRS